MAVEIKREVTLGKGERGFQFAPRKDEKKDREIYEAGRKLESKVRRNDSLATRIIKELMSVPSPSI